MIDLSWSSSRLEGNTYSLLATEELFKSGEPPMDWDGVMLLHHKRAIEFLVDVLPTYGLGDIVIRNLHALLMQDLLADAAGLGAIRSKVVNISGTTYVPSQAPQLLEEMLTHTECLRVRSPRFVILKSCRIWRIPEIRGAGGSHSTMISNVCS